MMILWIAVAAGLLLGFWLYPREMIGLAVSAVRAIVSLVYDGLALLLAWI